MSMPFYVAPEQVMKDRADYARKGIARGRSLVALEYADGIALVAEEWLRHQRTTWEHRLDRLGEVLGESAAGHDTTQDDPPKEPRS